MGAVVIPRPVKLICGILAGSPGWLERSREALAGRFGEIEAASEPVPFGFTDYYREEMGGSVLRQFVSFSPLISADSLAGIKRATNEMEIHLSEGGKRQANLDPGYLDLSKLVLATTKDATYRVYLGQGIHAQPTLFFRDGSFRPWEWTYQDYREAGAIEFFNKVRGVYRQDIRKQISQETRNPGK
jgi:hypothetical protein